MTGFVCRIKRAGEWVYVDFDELSDAEFDRVELPCDDGWMWAIGLAKWIRDNLQPRSIEPEQVKILRFARPENDDMRGVK